MISSVDMETEKNSMMLEEERERIHNALEKYNSHSQYFLPEEDLNRVNYLLSCLCDFLNADAEPVRHGHWVTKWNQYDNEGYPIRTKGRCSCCNQSSDVSDYCGNCGAKMDEDTE